MRHPLLVRPCSISQFFQMIGDTLLERSEGLTLNPLQILDMSQGTFQESLSEKYPTAHSIHLPWNEEQTWLGKIPSQDKSLDLIISNLALPWCPHIDQVFLEFARVLKPEGTLLFSTLGPETLKELRQSASIKTQYFTDIHDLGDLLLQIGFTHPVVDAEWFEYHCTGTRELLKELRKYQAYPNELTKKSRLKMMLTAYEQYRSPEGDWPVSVEVIYGYATGQKKEPYGRFKV